MTTVIAFAAVAVLAYLIGTLTGFTKGYEDGYDSAAIDIYMAENEERLRAAKEGRN